MRKRQGWRFIKEAVTVSQNSLQGHAAMIILVSEETMRSKERRPTEAEAAVRECWCAFVSTHVSLRPLLLPLSVSPLSSLPSFPPFAFPFSILPLVSPLSFFLSLPPSPILSFHNFSRGSFSHDCSWQ